MIPKYYIRQIKKSPFHLTLAQFGIEGKAAVRDRERAALAVPIQGAEIPFAWPGNELHDEEGISHTSVYRRVPSMQSYRNNLTALSQVYNVSGGFCFELGICESLALRLILELVILLGIPWANFCLCP